LKKTSNKECMFRYALTSCCFYELSRRLFAVNIYCYLAAWQRKSALSKRPFSVTYANYGMDENTQIIRWHDGPLSVTTAISASYDYTRINITYRRSMASNLVGD